MRKIAWFVLLTMIVSGCGETAKFMYPTNRQNLVSLSEEPKYNLKVAVLPFEENRKAANNHGSPYIALIPLVPFSKYVYERPDAAQTFNTIRSFQFDVSEDIAKAVVTSLKQSNLFEDVYFTYGGDKENADLIVSGSVNSAKYEGSTITYCISVYGAYLWLLGLPAGTSKNELSLSISMNSQRSKDALWNYNFTKISETIKQGIYYHWGEDIQYFPLLMEEGMNEAIRDLDKKLATMQIEELKK